MLFSSALLASSYDIGSINASADGVHIHTVLQLAKDKAGRLKISNMTCNASIARMHVGFSGTLRYSRPRCSCPVPPPDLLSAPAGPPQPRLGACMGTEGQGGSQGSAGGCRAVLVSCRKVYQFLSTFIISGMRYLLSQQVRQGRDSQQSLALSCPAAGGGDSREAEGGPGSSPEPGSSSPQSPAPSLPDLPVPGAC